MQIHVNRMLNVGAKKLKVVGRGSETRTCVELSVIARTRTTRTLATVVIERNGFNSRCPPPANSVRVNVFKTYVVAGRFSVIYISVLTV